MAATIFDLGLSVEAVSLFLLIEGLEGSKIDPDKNCTAKSANITADICLAKWNGEDADFKRALSELLAVGAIKDNNSELGTTKPAAWKTK
ncbi:hypothetical protein [Maridesulfovibrio hydrothermalis]|uniref:Uncharacterized protein n=1 Tax=Maridesulfovibrio hydrothermalis AM13 = DSM 14728 TaxID=1121451 RepID=L0R827_9BACT|nr:hypothetical protein [Maridesulfovibrio hydrothermalis]CCO22889.1 conserved protein of unknown function [Maridesulfovibrio hydrothermalis AM13 = DSM 14728]